MPHFRHINTADLAYPVLALAIDDTKAAFRILDERGHFANIDSQAEGKCDDLKTTQKLASPFFGNRDTYYGICQDTSKKLVRSLFIPEEPQQGLCPYASLPQDIFLT